MKNLVVSVAFLSAILATAADSRAAWVDIEAGQYYLDMRTGVNALGASRDNMLSVLGVADGATSIGVFSGTTFTGYSDIHTVLQEAETAIENRVQGEVTIYAQAADPGACVAGDLWVDTDGTSGQQLYVCESGSFVLSSGGGGGSVDESAAYDWTGAHTFASDVDASDADVILPIAGTPEAVCITVGDLDTDLTTSVSIPFPMPWALTVTAVRARVETAPTGADLIFDINESGTSILSTKLSIDATEYSSLDAAVPAVISDSSIVDFALMTIDVDQIGSTVAGQNAVVCIYGTRQ